MTANKEIMEYSQIGNSYIILYFQENQEEESRYAVSYVPLVKYTSLLHKTAFANNEVFRIFLSDPQYEAPAFGMEEFGEKVIVIPAVPLKSSVDIAGRMDQENVPQVGVVRVKPLNIKVAVTTLSLAIFAVAVSCVWMGGCYS